MDVSKAQFHQLIDRICNATCTAQQTFKFYWKSTFTLPTQFRFRLSIER